MWLVPRAAEGREPGPFIVKGAGEELRVGRAEGVEPGTRAPGSHSRGGVGDGVLCVAHGDVALQGPKVEFSTFLSKWDL